VQREGGADISGGTPAFQQRLTRLARPGLSFLRGGFTSRIKWWRKTRVSSDKMSMTVRSASEDKGVVFSELKFLSLQRSIHNFQANSILHAAR
jgi:hypothetical protein